MSRSDRRGVVALALALGLVAGLAQAKEALLPAAKLFPFLREYLALSPSARDHFAPTYMLIAKLGKLTGAQMWLVVDGRRTPLSVAADGRIAVSANAADIARGEVAIALPPGTRAGVRMEVAAVVPLHSEIPVELLDASLAQANRALHTGMPFITPPPFRRVEFPGAEGGELVAAGGQHSLLPVHDRIPYYEPSHAPGAKSVSFRRPPLQAILKAED